MELDVTEPISFDIVIEPRPIIPVTAGDAPKAVGLYAVPGTPGATGEPGPPGPAFDGTAWWFGVGVPDTIIGSKPGDFYIDTYTGIVYELN